jgi:chromosome segregation ATPase
MICLTQKSG